MSKKRILTVGLELASSETDYADFQSKQSLLDWDIILFKPQILTSFYTSDQFQGKPSLSQDKSFQLSESCEHWCREIKQTVKAGRTVIIFATHLEEVYIDTGERTYSGTGRNQKTTVQVAKYNNYCSIPADLMPVQSTGSAMKLSERGGRVLATYWKEFECDSQYQVIFSGSNIPDCILTNTGDKPVGAIFRNKSTTGTLLVLPDIDFYPDHFSKETENEDEWTPAAEQFAARMIATLVALDKSFHSNGELLTPEPQWATNIEYILEPERNLRTQLLRAKRSVEEAQEREEELKQKIETIGTYRNLLFEKGKPLENAIVTALQVMGFRATPFKDSDSEFDVVFESNEGRLIGEVESKDNKSVSVEKLRQLTMNIHEDLLREEVSNPTKPVLFGNAFRLQPITSRGKPFTEKCIKSAVMFSTALVFTPDLFFVVKYLLHNEDLDYARECRRTLSDTNGRVSFPKPPDLESSEKTC